jgi:radical SAM protein with 4Fe4S-binding SPASM domain
MKKNKKMSDLDLIKNAKYVPQFNQKRMDLAANLPLQTPLVIYVEPSSFCNLECKFCPQYLSSDAIVKKNMSMNVFKKLISNIGEFTNKPTLLRYCGLGDSLFNKEFLEMAKHAHKSDVVERTELVTNGILLNDNLIKELPKYIDRIIISIEGLSDEDYFKYTNRKIDFKNFISNITQLNAVNGKAKLHLKIHNAAVLDEVRKKRFFDVFEPICDEIYIENLVNLWPDLTSNMGVNAGQRFDGGSLNKVKVCPQIFKSMQINSDGRVIPCCIDWEGINIIGDIKNQNLRQIWNGDILKTLRNKHLKGLKSEIDPCKECTMNDYSEKDNLDNDAKLIYSKLNAN